MPVACVALVSRDIIKSSYFGCSFYPAAPSDAAAGSSPLSLKQALALNVFPVDIRCLWGPVVFVGGTRRGPGAHVSWGVGKQQGWGRRGVGSPQRGEGRDGEEDLGGFSWLIRCRHAGEGAAMLSPH